MNLTPEQEEKIKQIDMDFSAAGLSGFQSALSSLLYTTKTVTESLDNMGFILGDYRPTFRDRIEGFCYDLIYKPLIIIFRFYRWLKKVIVDAWEDSE